MNTKKKNKKQSSSQLIPDEIEYLREIRRDIDRQDRGMFLILLSQEERDSLEIIPLEKAD